MAAVENLALVFVAGFATALATGLGALPFFFVEEFSDRWNVGLWGVASGIMVSASVFGLLNEGLAYSSGLPIMLSGGLLAGAVLVELSDRVLDALNVGHSHDDGDEHRLEAEAFAAGDAKKLLLILGILPVHSFPEGVASASRSRNSGWGAGSRCLASRFRCSRCS